MQLYIAGARIHTAYGMAPILDGLGLILVVFSYNGRISISASSCEQIVPDPEFLIQCIAGSLDELEEAIGPEQAMGSNPAAELDESHASARIDASAGTESLKAFREASRALDVASESLKGLDK